MAAKMHRAKLPADFSAKVRAGLSIPAHSMPVARDGARRCRMQMSGALSTPPGGSTRVTAGKAIWCA